MRNKILLAGIALLSLPLALPAQAQNNGNDRQGSEKGKSADRKDDAGEATDRADKGPGKAKVRIPDVANQNARSGNRSDGNNGGAVITSRGQEGRVERFPKRVVENDRYIWREPSFQGCPPGLAKKGNGCLPPGQARKLGGFDGQGTRWDRYSNWFNANRSDDWRYHQGYAYRIDPVTNLVRGIVPLLGGALFGGNIWPQSYTDYRVSPYYARYYGSGATNGVRYADGAIFRVDPQTQMISSIAGLVTGDDWNVGSPAPQGYELYNVPYNYRDRYADDERGYYRYNDGYIYEIDPTTQLVRQIIELIV